MMTTKLTDQAIVALRLTVPPDRKDDVALIVSQLTGSKQPLHHLMMRHARRPVSGGCRARPEGKLGEA